MQHSHLIKSERMLNMKDINVFIDQLKEKYVPVLLDRVEKLFVSEDFAVKCEMATDLLITLPFEIVSDYHEWGFEDLKAGGRERLYKDREGHNGMSGKAVASHYDPAAPKTADERFDYFKGITIVFPYMLMAGHHRWLFEGVEGAKDYNDFMAKFKDASCAKYEPLLKAAYEGKADLCETYKAQAAEHPFDLLKNYYNWVNE